VPGPRGEKGEKGERGEQGPPVQFETGQWNAAKRLTVNEAGRESYSFTNTSDKPLEVFFAAAKHQAPQSGQLFIKVGEATLPKIGVSSQTDTASFVVPTGQTWTFELHNVELEYSELPL
jgi:hypothetical protein